MASMWSILGIEGPTEDLRAIKRAYAKKLKITRPDDDPEAFMALRQALERATAYAQHRHFEIAVEAEPPATETDRKTEPVHIGREPDVPPEPEDTAFDLHVRPLLSRAEELLGDPQARQDYASWTALLDDSLLLSIDDHLDFENGLRHVFLSRLGYFEGKVEAPSKRWFDRFKKETAFMNRDTAEALFVRLGWNRWKQFHPYVQNELLWLIYELQLKPRPQPIESDYELWKKDFKRTFVYSVMCVAGILALTYLDFSRFVPDITHTPTLPTSGQTQYGHFQYNPETDEYAYTLNKDHVSFQGEQVLKFRLDQFKIQRTPDTVTKVSVFISLENEEPEFRFSELPGGEKQRKATQISNGVFLATFILFIMSARRIYLLFKRYGLAFYPVAVRQFLNRLRSK